MTQQQIDEILNTMVMQAQQLGLEGFLLGFCPEPGKVTLRFQKMKMKEALDVICGAFKRAIDLEIAQTTPDRKKILKGLLADFEAIIKRANGKMGKVK